MSSAPDFTLNAFPFSQITVWIFQARSTIKEMLTVFGKRLFAGTVAGLAGGLAMRVVVKAWERVHHNDIEHGPFGLDVQADRNAAILLWRKFSNAELQDKPAEWIGAGCHYLLSAASGAGFAVLPDWARRGAGLPYGLAVWLFGDLIAVSASGVSDPAKKTLDSHAVAVAAHVLYGAVVNNVTKTIQR